MSLERDLEQVLREAAESARTRGDVVASIYARLRRRQRKLRIAVGSVVAVVALAGAVAAVPRLGSAGSSSGRAPGAALSPSPSPSPSLSLSPSPSPSVSISPSPTFGVCGPSSLSLSAGTDARGYDEGQTVVITRSVRNTGRVPCSTGGTGCVPPVAVQNDRGTTIWSSTPPGGGTCARLPSRVLKPGQRWDASYQWDQTECVRDAAEPCGGYPHASPGTYYATTTWYAPGEDLSAISDSFFLACCSASPSPTPSPGITLIP